MLNCPLEKNPEKKKILLLARLFLLAFTLMADKSLKPIKPGEISTIMGLISACNVLISNNRNLNDLGYYSLPKSFSPISQY